MMMGESRVEFLSALSSEKGEAILADSWTGMSEKTLKPKERVPPTAVEAACLSRVAASGGRL
jgi:hypothetical protein